MPVVFICKCIYFQILHHHRLFIYNGYKMYTFSPDSTGNKKTNKLKKDVSTIGSKTLVT